MHLLLVAGCYNRTAVGNRKTHEDDIFASLKLKTLHIHGYNIGDKGKELIVAVLSKTILLENFNISNCNLNTINATEIVRALKNVSSMKSFNLSSNAICKEAASNIVQFISNNPKLEELNLSDNEISTGVLHIAVSLSNKFIRSLDISKNCITADYIEGIVSALAQCPSLEDLNMSNNLLTFTGIVKVAEGLRGNRSLQTLNLNNNLTSFHSEGEFLVDVILSTNQSLVYLNICGRNIRPRFTYNHFFPPPGTELTSARFLLQKLYQLSLSPSFDMLTFKNTAMNRPDEFIKVTEEICPIVDHNIVSYYVDHDGGTFYNQDHDFAIVIPPGAVSQGECVEIIATASFLGPYQFPDECNPVSSFFWVSSNYTFKIPVYLIMSHYAVIKNVNDINSLCVLQVCKYDLSSTTKEKKLMMKEILNGVYFDYKIRYCIAATTHFCSFGVQEKTKGNLSKRFKILCYDYRHHDEDAGEQYITEVCFYPNNCSCSKVILH